MAKHINKEGKPCPYCTRLMVLGNLKLTPTSDHIKPKSKFNNVHPRGVRGSGNQHNRTITVCSECNFMKADLSLHEFLWVLMQKNELMLEAIATNTERIENIQYLIRIGIDKE